MPKFREPPVYDTPVDFTCPHCQEESIIIPDLCDFNYSYGDEDGTHYPPGWGQAICSDCGGEVEGAELLEQDYD